MNNEYKHVLHAPPQRLWLCTAIFCTGGLDVIRNEALTFYRTISGVRLCWELEEPREPHLRRIVVRMHTTCNLNYIQVLEKVDFPCTCSHSPTTESISLPTSALRSYRCTLERLSNRHSGQGN